MSITPFHAVRMYFGLAQSVLAGMLGVSRGRLSMAETGRRQLPTAAWLRLAPLAGALPPAGAPAPDEESALPPAPPEALRQHLRACEWELGQLSRELTARQQRAARARRQLAAVALLEPELLLTDTAAWEQLTLLRDAAQPPLEPAAAAAGALLLVRRAGLRAEAAEAARLLAVGAAEKPG